MPFSDRESSSPLAEALERRVLLTSVSFDGETLFITGDESAQIIEVDAGSWNTTVRVDEDGNGVFTDPGDFVMPYGQVTKLDIRTAGGDDQVTVHFGMGSGATTITSLSVDAGAGDDNLAIRSSDGSGGSVRLPGSLSIKVIGGDGNDVVSAGFGKTSGSVRFDVNTGAGDDRASFGFGPYLYGSAGGIVRLGDGNDSFSAGVGGREYRFRGNVTFTVYGGAGQDTLGGSASSDPEIHSRSGSLTLHLNGEAGDDYMSKPSTTSNVSVYVTTDSDDPPPPPGPQYVSIWGDVIDWTQAAHRDGIDGVTVYLDTNGNGELDESEPQSVTLYNGRYDFYVEPMDSYTVRAIAPDGWQFVGADSITFGPDEPTYRRNFALTTIGIRGTVATSTWPASGTVFLDTNNNGALDPGEQQRDVDQAGRYEFLGLAAGSYMVRLIPPAGFAAVIGTDPACSLELAENQVAAANFQIGRSDVWGGVDRWEGIIVFAETDRDGRFDDGEPSARTDRNGQYSLGELPAGSYSILVIPPDGWMAESYNSPETVVVANRAGPSKYFRLWPPGLSGAVGIVGDTRIPVQVYLDLNSNETLDQGEPTTQTNEAGRFWFGALPEGVYHVRPIIPEGFRPREEMDKGQLIQVTEGQWQRGVHFVLTPIVTEPPVLSISGSVYDDANRNGLKDYGWMELKPEHGISGVTVYLDDGRSTTTDAFGWFEFRDVAKGTHRLRVASEGWTTFAPKGGVSQVVIEDYSRSASFGMVPVGERPPVGPSSLSGTAFEDSNSNGIFDDGEAGVAGVVLFLDSNENHELDAGEKTTVTDAAGAYTFAGLEPGEDQVIAIRPDGMLVMNQPQPTGVGMEMDVVGVDIALLPYTGDVGYLGTNVTAPQFDGTADDDVIHVSAAMVQVNGQQVPGVQVTINGQAGEAFVPEVYFVIGSGAGNDRITIDADVSWTALVYGGEGDDIIHGGGGNDVIDGGNGDDVIFGRSGNDVLYGLGGDDCLYGGDGDDVLSGGEWHDRCSGGIGKDTISGDAGLDTLNGGPGADSITGGDHGDQISGGAGPDTLIGNNGLDAIYGGKGADRIEGNGKADTLHGGLGNDTILSGAGADLVFGEDGDDDLCANQHPLFRDQLRGGAGRDKYEADQEDLLTEVEDVLA